MARLKMNAKVEQISVCACSKKMYISYTHAGIRTALTAAAGAESAATGSAIHGVIGNSGVGCEDIAGGDFGDGDFGDGGHKFHG